MQGRGKSKKKQLRKRMKEEGKVRKQIVKEKNVGRG